jgi:tetratricopeptide (TPR) repeat protein
MKKILITVCTALTLANLEAQTIQDGINHLYADRFRNAEQTFQKILATNPNVAEATYWLGQTYLDMDNNDAARQLYDKALAANGNNPLLMVGKGHVLLLDKKKDEARQLFESAITISTTKKGDDPVILNAIGRANVDAKEGNLDYAVQVLEKAMQRDPKNPDIALNLGNAFRKRDIGVGGKAYENYKLATELNPRFAYPYLRIAKIYETQKQWDLVLENLNKALQVDPSYSLAFYELFYYYFFAKQDYATAEQMLQKYINTRPNEDQWEHDYLAAQLCWARKDYECAVTKAEAVKATMGTKVKPRVLKLLAYSYLGKNDFATAKRYVDEFFVKEKDGFVGPDYQLKVDIYSGAGVPCDQLYTVFMEGAAADTVQQSKIDYLAKAADYFKSKGCKLQEADMRMAWFNTRGNASPTYLVNFGILYLQADQLAKADSIFSRYISLAPDSIYGYSWRGRVNFSLDTTMTVEPYVTNMVNSYDKALTIAATDPLRYKNPGITAAKTLAAYYVNVKSSRDTALTYVYKGLAIDSTDAALKSIRDILEKSRNQKPTGRTTGSKPSAAIRKPADKG